MTDHPNTVAAAVAGGATLAAQWLVQRYAHVALADYWKDAVTVATTAAVLYVGRNGLKAAVVRILNGPKKVWTGTPKASAK